jgi:hypothetical protein
VRGVIVGKQAREAHHDRKDRDTMSPHASTLSAATAKQIAYLRSLALQTGTTFSVPRTRRQASCEIGRMKELKARSGKHVEAPRDTDPGEEHYATAVQPHEVCGFGSQASWYSSSPAIVRTTPQRRVGELTELARYEVNGGERVLYGQRINGCVRVVDRPAKGPGRSYLVDRELEHDGYSALKALVADYTQQARELGAVPMASSQLVEQTAADAA